MLLVQKYLRSGKTLDDLVKDHGVYATITNRKISLNYDQLEASNSNPLACECRGLILAEGSYDIIAFPFQRFFNLEQEGVAANIDLDSAKYLEKIDGTLGIVYKISNHWYFATRSRPEADVPLEQDSNLTFSKLADLACQQMYLAFKNDSVSSSVSLQDLMEDLVKINPEAKNKTFMFELTSPYNRVVCRYDDVKLTLLGVRDNITLKEEEPDAWIGHDRFGLTTPKVYCFDNIEQMIKVVREWNPEQHEGVVVRDKCWNRVKVKNPAYLALNRLNQSLLTSIKGCVELILLNKEDDVIGMVPELIAKRILRLKPVIQEVFSITQKDWEELKEIKDIKTFALAAQKRLWPAALFALKKNKTPDLKTFSLGKRIEVSKISTSAVEMMLDLCKKLDPDVGKLI